MALRAIPVLALLTALCLACNGRSSGGEPGAPAEAATHEHTAGAERGLPELQTYAHRLDDPARDEWQKPGEVIELLGCPSGGTVVDVGAGTGYFIAYLSRCVGDQGQVLALDIAPETVELLQDRARQEGLQNVAAKTVAPDDPALGRRAADRILVTNTWHHIDQRIAYAKKLLPALRRGGRLVIVDFTMESPTGPPLEKRLTVDTVVQELEAAGFATQILEETLPYQYAVEGRAR